MFLGQMSKGVVGVMPGETEEVHHVELLKFQADEEPECQGGLEDTAMVNDLKRRNQWDTQHGKPTYDALTNQLLNEELVIQGKEAEMKFLHKWAVYEYADYAEAHAETGKRPISTRWVCTNKGDNITPDVRCRWVAR